MSRYIPHRCHSTSYIPLLTYTQNHSAFSSAYGPYQIYNTYSCYRLEANVLLTTQKHLALSFSQQLGHDVHHKQALYCFVTKANSLEIQQDNLASPHSYRIGSHHPTDGVTAAKHLIQMYNDLFDHSTWDEVDSIARSLDFFEVFALCDYLPYEIKTQGCIAHIEENMSNIQTLQHLLDDLHACKQVDA